jgi:hypothetical protein
MSELKLCLRDLPETKDRVYPQKTRIIAIAHSVDRRNTGMAGFLLTEGSYTSGTGAGVSCVFPTVEQLKGANGKGWVDAIVHGDRQGHRCSVYDAVKLGRACNIGRSIVRVVSSRCSKRFARVEYRSGTHNGHDTS